MPELTDDFQSLPEEYRRIIRLAQDTYNFTVAPLQLLVGGWSGAVVYLVSVSLKARQGATRWGATLLGAAESLLLSTGGAWWPADRVEVERNREMLQTALSDDEFTKA